MHRRILKIIRHYNLSVSEFSREIGLNSPATIQKIITYNRKASPKTTGKILNRFKEINYDWLITGEGQMTKNESNHSKTIDQDDLTVTAKQVINFIKNDVIDYIDKQIGVNHLEFIKQIEEVGVKMHKKFLPDVTKNQEKVLDIALETTKNFLETKFLSIDNQILKIKENTNAVNNKFSNLHDQTLKKVEGMEQKVIDIAENVKNLNVLIGEIETKLLIEHKVIKKYITPKK